MIMALKGEEDAVSDTNCAENTPTIHKPDLAGGDERFRSVADRAVMKQMPVHGFILANLVACAELRFFAQDGISGQKISFNEN